MRSDARAGPDVSEYQATLDRLRDLGFDGDAELLERSLPVPHAERPPGSSWAAATPEPQMSPAELLAFDKFVEVLASRHDDAMLGLLRLAARRARHHGFDRPFNEKLPIVLHVVLVPAERDDAGTLLQEARSARGARRRP